MATIVSVPRATMLGEISANGRTLLPPIAVCAVMGLCAAVTARLAHLTVWPLMSYFNCFRVTLICLALFALGSIAASIILRKQEVLKNLGANVVERLPLLLLPAIILPAFLIGYTTTKTAIPVLVGYTWDAFWANADRLIFGEDVWRLCRAVFGDKSSQFWEWWYAVVWAVAFLLTANFVALMAKRKFVGVYFTSMMAVWLIGGFLMAYAFSAAGPVFAPIFDPSLADRFRPLQDVLNQTLGHRSIATAQRYLVVAATDTHVAVTGGGISAFPSMHLATCSINVLAARRTRWLLPAITFWILIFIGSGYFGFHYWIDGIVSAVLAVLCWKASEAVYSRLGDASPISAARLEPAAG